MKKRNLRGIILVLTFFLFWSFFAPSILAADPGHSARVIAANDFASGNERFPDSFQKIPNVLNIEYMFEKSKDIKGGRS